MSYTLRLSSSASRTQVRSQRAIQTAGEPGKKVSDDISKEEVRRQQEEKYVEDKKKFLEKEKEKAEKKRQERWKRYSHADLGTRLNSNAQVEMNDVDFIREQQQMMYKVRSQSGLEREKQKEAARCKREEQKQKERLEKKSSISTGLRLDDGARSSRDIDHVSKTGRIEKQLQNVNINTTTCTSITSLLENYSVLENTISQTNESTVNKPSNAEKEEMYREQMKRAREKMQQKYDEIKYKQ